MKSKVLIDTNIFIYSINADSEYLNLARNLLNDRSYELYTTNKNISEFLAVVTKGEKPLLSIKQALEIIQKISEFVQIIYPDKSSFEIFKVLLKKYHPKGLKIHDFEIVSIALNKKIKTFATINRVDFKAISEINLLF